MNEEEYSKGYENYFDGDMKKDICKDKRVVIIAEKPKEFYTNTIIEKLSRFDQVEIQVLDAYKEKTEFIVKFLRQLGILPINGYPIKFEHKQIHTNGKKRICYINSLLLTKIPEVCRFIYDGVSRDMDKEKTVIIEKMPIGVYKYIIEEKFQKFDQVEIQVLDAYIDKAIDVIKSFEGIGIIPEDGYPIKFRVKEEEITPKNNLGEKYKAVINKVVITKIPPLYKYTNN